MRVAAKVLVVTALACLPACTSTKVAGKFEGEPVCADFSISDNMMKGSLRYPVKITIYEEGDEDDPMWERVRYGKRSASDKATVFAIADGDEEYVVRWAQCPNQFAPKPVEAAAKTTDRAGGYACGEAKEYAKTKLVVKAGDASSRVIAWQPAPDSTCWKSDDTPAAPASASASAEKPAPAAPSPSVEASGSAAPEDPAPSAAPSASAAPTAAPTAAPDDKKP